MYKVQSIVATLALLAVVAVVLATGSLLVIGVPVFIREEDR